MSKTLVQELQIALKKFNAMGAKNSKLKELEEANKKFEKLIENGILKKRGNNLLSFDEKHLHKIDSYKVNF